MNQIHSILPCDAQYPPTLCQRLGGSAPQKLTAIGNLDLLALPKTAIFCSTRCPGDAILRAYDQAANLRDAGRCVVSGFHSPVEKECLHILLRGKKPIIICPARGLDKFRLPALWKSALAADRMLILSCFTNGPDRPTVETAHRRNEFVAALADEILFAHITVGGRMERLVEQVKAWRISYNGSPPENSQILNDSAKMNVPSVP